MSAGSAPIVGGAGTSFENEGSALPRRCAPFTTGQCVYKEVKCVHQRPFKTSSLRCTMCRSFISITRQFLLLQSQVV